MIIPELLTHLCTHTHAYEIYLWKLNLCSGYPLDSNSEAPMTMGLEAIKWETTWLVSKLLHPSHCLAQGSPSALLHRSVHLEVKIAQDTPLSLQMLMWPTLVFRPTWPWSSTPNSGPSAMVHPVNATSVTPSCREGFHYKPAVADHTSELLTGQEG